MKPLAELAVFRLQRGPLLGLLHYGPEPDLVPELRFYEERSELFAVCLMPHPPKTPRAVIARFEKDRHELAHQAEQSLRRMDDNRRVVFRLL